MPETDLTEFVKLEGLGNDFVLVDGRDRPFTASAAGARRWSDRHTGIGFDQLLILHPHPSAIARVEILNADGSSAEQCGNGMRAIAAWLHRRGELGDDAALATPAGPVELQRAAEGQFTAVLPGPREIEPASLGLSWPTLTGDEPRPALISMGNPHLVLITADEPGAGELARIVAEVERCEGWRNAANISLARIDDRVRVGLRVHERGAGPTAACGSAACAAAWIATDGGRRPDPVRVAQPGGTLVVDFNTSDGRVRTTGPARVVFEGRIA